MAISLQRNGGEEMLRSTNGKYWRNDMEITFEEYTVALNEVRAKVAFADAIIRGDSTIEDCPYEWREDVAQMVSDRTEEHAEDADPADLLSIILGQTP